MTQKRMEEMKPGDLFYHKATKHRCVVIKTTEDMVKVRDEKNVEQDYYPQELETEAEIDAKNDAEVAALNQANEDRDVRY